MVMGILGGGEGAWSCGLEGMTGVGVFYGVV